MSIWIVTTGSSDAQLQSDESWHRWHRSTKHEYYRLPFKPNAIEDDSESRFRLASRVLGLVYDAQPEEVWEVLQFPLLDGFVAHLQAISDLPTRIILLLTDQNQIFDENDRETVRCPYWQDTCELKPMFRRYFAEKFPNADCVSLVLEPMTQNEGLDDWNAVLSIVDRALSSLKFEENATVYVSHQAGTPAISSAVQFTSLSRFGQQVKFLVSSERDLKLTKVVDSSEYLKGIRKQEAKALLDRYDYSGVRSLLAPYLKQNDTQFLLNAAIDWNFAQFSEFASTLMAVSDSNMVQTAQDRVRHWWWIAYEEVYLAVVRRNQGNIVEAFFHSFRAFEGIFAAWGKHQLGEYFELSKEIPYLNPLVLDDGKEYFSNKRCKDVRDLKNLKEKLEDLRGKPLEEIKSDDRVELNMATLCKIFRGFRYKDYKRDCGELKIFWDSDKENNVSEKRNFIVHQVQGMSESSLYDFWGVSEPEAWEGRLLKFLNFIVGDDLAEEFESLEDASLMVNVHQKLEEAIAQL